MPPVHQLPNDNSNKYKILFVCLGNICRSPAAQGIMEKMIADRGLQDRFYVDSAGTYGGHNGSLPDERMRIHARRRGYELTHLSRQVTGHDFETFDLIVIMDKNNLHGLRCMKDVVDERKVVEIIHDAGISDSVAVQSFSDESLDELHRLDGTLRLEKLVFFGVKGLPKIFDGGFSTFDYAKYTHVSSFNFYYRSLTRRMVDALHSHGKQVKIWTLAGPEDTPHLPVDGIITDRPDLWRSNRNKALLKRRRK